MHNVYIDYGRKLGVHEITYTGILPLLYSLGDFCQKSFFPSPPTSLPSTLNLKKNMLVRVIV